MRKEIKVTFEIKYLVYQNFDIIKRINFNVCVPFICKQLNFIVIYFNTVHYAAKELTELCN